MGLFKNKHKSSPFSGDIHQRTLHKNLEFTATEQYKLLRTNLNFTIPEGTQSGTSFTLRGKGIQMVNGKNRGDLIFTVTIETPKGLLRKR